MAEIKELEKDVEEGALKDEALDGAAGGCGPVSFATVFGVDLDKPGINAVSDKRENC